MTAAHSPIKDLTWVAPQLTVLNASNDTAGGHHPSAESNSGTLLFGS